jgi:hypothetical protein
MKEKLDSIFLNNPDSQLVLYSSIASIIIGVVLFLVGFYFKKKNKQWWVIVSLIGVVAIITNGIKFII